MTIPRRFRGPSNSGNGGYTCGLLAAFVDADSVEVTLRGRPPLDRLLMVSGDGHRVVLLDDEAVVAEAAPQALQLELPAPVGAEEARAAERRFAGFGEHVFPECFVCGPARPPGDGLRIFAGPVEGRDGVVAARWVAREVTAPVLWAAIDCPGAFAVGMSGRGETVLGRMTARILGLPRDGEPCVSVGWPLGEDGRKLFAGTALFGESGDPLAIARQTWIVPRAAP
jgi:hypothetical protein